MALYFLHFNKRKSKVMVFGHNESFPPIDLGSLATQVKLAITNPGFKMDSDFNLDHQIGAIVRTSFF